jgi:hypothetical protein
MPRAQAPQAICLTISIILVQFILTEHSPDHVNDLLPPFLHSDLTTLQQLIRAAV